MFKIKTHIHSEKMAVVDFLNKLKEVINSEDFNICDDLIIIKSSKEEKEYSTPYTIANLEYDTNDIADRLRELTLQEYSETLMDLDDDNPPLLFVFGKDINGRKVYIKLKIKSNTKKKVLCLSFHYSKHDMVFPYAK